MGCVRNTDDAPFSLQSATTKGRARSDHRSRVFTRDMPTAWRLRKLPRSWSVTLANPRQRHSAKAPSRRDSPALGPPRVSGWELRLPAREQWRMKAAGSSGLCLTPALEKAATTRPSGAPERPRGPHAQARAGESGAAGLLRHMPVMGFADMTNETLPHGSKADTFGKRLERKRGRGAATTRVAEPLRRGRFREGRPDAEEGRGAGGSPPTAGSSIEEEGTIPGSRPGAGRRAAATRE